MPDIAISTDHLTRRFGKFTAVDGISFEIPYGSIFGFLGANGAGKSTTIRMLCGILAPTSGEGKVGGFDVQTQPEQIKTVIGYVSQRFSLYADLNVAENLNFYGRIYGLEGSALAGRIKEVLTLTGLAPFQRRLAGDLSGGMKQKLAVANAILHKPKIIFLDEPTAGLDPLSRRGIWELLYQLAESGTSLFVTTHYMEEAERCNTIAFISQGRILKIGRPAELKEELKGQILEVAARPLMKASHVFSEVEGVHGVTVYGTTLNLNAADPKAVEERVRQAAAREGIQVASIKPIAASLEDVFSDLDLKKVKNAQH
ncbi:MAG: ABC transporter ATP-binding protein [Candidatus Omnitrophica bacterium]|nr:ABC transporter ATP-binding protein [Candidatus Omnitrophota bacterium]MDE2221518.1 ABC transporter ATP-binding protein [Candidatus Omnitrophota bacterium]